MKLKQPDRSGDPGSGTEPKPYPNLDLAYLDQLYLLKILGYRHAGIVKICS